jgi:hypothetical protein
VQDAATGLLNDQLVTSERRVRTLESSMEGVDLAQAKIWSQEKFSLQKEVQSLRARLDEKPSELAIMEKMADILNVASSSSLTGALPFVQALTGNMTPTPSNTQNSSSSSSKSLLVRLADIEIQLGLNVQPAQTKLGLLPRIEKVEEGFWGADGATPQGGIPKRLALLEKALERE